MGQCCSSVQEEKVFHDVPLEVGQVEREDKRAKPQRLAVYSAASSVPVQSAESGEAQKIPEGSGSQETTEAKCRQIDFREACCPEEGIICQKSKCTTDFAVEVSQKDNPALESTDSNKKVLAEPHIHSEFEITFDDDEIVVLGDDDDEIHSFGNDEQHTNTHGPATGSADASRLHSPINAKWFDDRGVVPPSVRWHQDSSHIFVVITPANSESGWALEGNILEYNCDNRGDKVRVELPLLEMVEEPHFTLVCEKAELFFLAKKVEDDDGHTKFWTQLIKCNRKDYIGLSWIRRDDTNDDDAAMPERAVCAPSMKPPVEEEDEGSDFSVAE